jgi:uncharacterized protein YPO0396
MTEALISLPDPDEQPTLPADDAVDDVAAPLPGFRLQRVEVLRWGTFGESVATFRPDGGSALLTGANGSGKSTIADALTALLAPPRKVAFNRSGGDEKQRTLLTYVRGYYTKVTNEETGAVQPVALRPKDDFYSVILAVFTNAVTGATATAAQVLWPPRSGVGQPDRFYATADRELSIVGDFTDFGSEITALKRRLRASGVTVADSYPQYAMSLRKFAAIPSEQAQDLFAQAVSVKGVSDLNAFMRTHMLEETDNSERIEEIVTHFDDLNSAHESIKKATAQIGQLAPLLADAGTYEGHVERAAELVTLTRALPVFIATGKAEALRERIAADEQRQATLTACLDETDDRAKTVGEQLRVAEQTRDGLGGTRLREIERELEVLDAERDARQARAGRHAEHLATLGRAPVTNQREFAALTAALPALQAELDSERAETGEHRDGLVTRKAAISQESNDIAEEIDSLQQRRTSIPRTSLALRDRLAAAVGTDPDDLPFAGELINVLEDSADWEGAAERVLHSFALSMLVPQIHYPAVSEWVNANHLGARLVYHRIPAASVVRPKKDLPEQALFHHLEVKDGPFTDWVIEELRTRADHVCAESMDQFRSSERAVTKAGQIKHGRGRHEKDDRRHVGDRSTYVLGWSNEAKIAALVERARCIYTQQAKINDDLDVANQTLAGIEAKLRAVATLAETTSWRDLDWPSAAAKITELTGERTQILAGSTEMANVTAKIEACQHTLAELAEQRRDTDRELGRLDERVEASYTQLIAAEELLEKASFDDAARDGLTTLVRDELPTAPEQWDTLASTLTGTLAEEQRLAERRIGDWRVALTKKMSAFRSTYPDDAIELDDSTDAIDAWRALYEQLTNDDLPRFQATFKRYLNQGSIREIAGLWAALKAQKDQIEAGLQLVNESLRTVTYNPGSYVELASAPSPNTEVREFQAMLRACIEGTVGDDTYSEERFTQVKRVIDRFAGREGYADSDKAWTRRVTDIRNWAVFRATERSCDDDAELESYDGSGGKSGGQTEKLAYTILGAALAWQYRLGTPEGRRRNFCFVLIDEAFQNVADDNARAALDLFAALGLQLLVVTPLTGVALIEPYVSAVGLASNTARFDNSAVRTLTIEEYRAERDARLEASRQAVSA